MREVWKTRTYWGGQWVNVKDLIQAGTHRIEAWGNSKEGWFPHLVSGDSGIDIGPYFGKDTGDTLRDLKEAAARAYGLEPKDIRKGRNWF